MGRAEQIADFKKSCCVNAGAGAGKTTCLVNAYLNLLKPEQGFSPEQIVVITFTEKAAGELAQRIQEAVAENEQQQIQLERLQWAPISTIHSFCGRLLRENASRCGLAPDFSILDARQFDDLLERTLQRLLRRWLKEGQLQGLLAHYRFKQLPPLFAHLLKASYINKLSPEGILKASLAALDEQSPDLGARRKQASAAKDALALELVRYQQEQQKNAEQTLAAEAGKKSQAAAKRIKKAIEGQQAGEALARHFQLLGRQWADGAGPLEMHATLAQAGSKPDMPQAALLEALRLLAMGQQWESARALTENLLYLFKEVYQTIENELYLDSALSFDHLLLKADALFREGEGFRENFHHQYPVIMVDEFQDVNPLQASLVEQMAGLRRDAHGSIIHIASRLLLVGDRKQSIYGFRGADVSVFSNMHEKFQNFSQAENFTLNCNYRSPRELINFFNQFFAETVFARNRGRAYEVQYSNELDRQLAGKIHEEKGLIEILNCEQPALRNREDLRRLEARAIAGHIESMIEPGKIDYRDIVILFRSLPQVSIYTQALGQKGIPHYIEQGGNFFQQPEVIDLALGLQSLERPLNPQALIGALLSPLFGFDLASLLAGLGRASLETCLQIAPPPDTPGAPAWSKAIDFYNTYSEIADFMQPAELITALLENTGWQMRLAASPQGGQKLANLRKLLEASRQPPWINSDLEYLWTELKRADKQPLAPLLSAQANVVRLMTIHQAKGLEFPVVFMPDLVSSEAPNAPPEDFLLSQDGILALNLGLKFNGESRKSYQSIFEQQYQDYKEREAAESARIFYVACTRAKRRLVFSYFKARSRSQWSEWLQQLLNDEQIIAAHNIKIIEPAVPAAMTAQPIPPDPGTMEPEVEVIINNCQPVTLKSDFITTSVSNLEEWLTCPRRGWLRQNLNIDWAAAGKTREEGASTPITELSSWQLGSLVHYIMELIDFNKPMDELYSLLDRLNLPPNQLEPLIQILAPIWQSELPAMLASYSDLQRETPFAMYLRDDDLTMEITGEIDLLATTSQTEALIVDYKVARPKAAQYAWQMKCYSLAWAGSKRKLPRVALCFLYDRKCQIIYQQYSQQDLSAFKQEILRAGHSMACAHNLSDLPRPVKCDPYCQLFLWCNR